MIIEANSKEGIAEFTVTQDEYGLVVVEVNGAGNTPKFTITRISRGNEGKFRKNGLKYSITIWKKERISNAPKALSPNDEIVKFTGSVLKTSPFCSAFEQAFHAASYWQIATTRNFDPLVFDSWKQHEKWYYEENKQKNDGLLEKDQTSKGKYRLFLAGSL